MRMMSPIPIALIAMGMLVCIADADSVHLTKCQRPIPEKSSSFIAVIKDTHYNNNSEYEYSRFILEASDYFCGNMNKCNRSAVASVNSCPIKCFPCNCKPNCIVYNDCCVDVNRTMSLSSLKSLAESSTDGDDVDESQNEGDVLTSLVPREFLTCVPKSLKNDSRQGYIYVIRYCPADYQNHTVIEGCVGREGGTVILPEDEDMFQLSNVTGMTYYNRFCAQCFSVNMSQLLPWKVKVECSSRTALRGIRTLDEYKTVIREHPACKVRWQAPDDAGMNKERSCVRNITTICNVTGEWHQVSTVKGEFIKACETQGFDVVSWNGRHYKNAFCAVCNGLVIPEFITRTVYNFPRTFTSDTLAYKTRYITKHFDVSPIFTKTQISLLRYAPTLVSDVKNDKNIPCNEDEMYNSFTSQQSAIYCPQGYVINDCKCHAIFSVAQDVIFVVKLYYQLNSNFTLKTIGVVAKQLSEELQNIFKRFQVKIGNVFITTIYSEPQYVMDNTYSSPIFATYGDIYLDTHDIPIDAVITKLSELQSRTFVLYIEDVNGNVTMNPYFDKLTLCSFYEEKSQEKPRTCTSGDTEITGYSRDIQCLGQEHGIAFPGSQTENTALGVKRNPVLIEKHDIKLDGHSEILYVDGVGVTTEAGSRDMSSDSVDKINASDAAHILGFREHVVRLLTVVTTVNTFTPKRPEFYAFHDLTCQYVKLNLSTITMDVRTKTISFNNSEIVLNASDFQICGEMIKLCIDFISLVNSHANDVTTPTYTVKGILSFVCITFSMVCLLITLFLYYVFKQNKSLPGKNMTGVAVALFLAQLVFQLSISIRYSEIICIIIGVFVHYLWLFVIVWTNVCAYNMYRVFTKPLKATARNPVTTFKIYTLYALLSPMGIVLVCIFANLGLSGGTNIGYGGYVCYISKPMHIGIFFTLPAMLMIVANVGFFSRTLMEFRTISRAALPTHHTDRNYVKVAFKMSLILGFTWIFGFLAIWTKNVVIEYIFIVLNGLHGVFILGSFCSSKQIRRAMFGRKRSHSQRGSRTISTPTAVTRLSGATT